MCYQLWIQTFRNKQTQSSMHASMPMYYNIYTNTWILLRTLATKIISKCRSFWEARRLSQTLSLLNRFFFSLALALAQIRWISSHAGMAFFFFTFFFYILIVTLRILLNHTACFLFVLYLLNAHMIYVWLHTNSLGIHLQEDKIENKTKLI